MPTATIAIEKVIKDEPNKHNKQKIHLDNNPNSKILLLLITSEIMPTGISASIFDAFIIISKSAKLPPLKPCFVKHVI